MALLALAWSAIVAWVFTTFPLDDNTIPKYDKPFMHTRMAFLFENYNMRLFLSSHNFHLWQYTNDLLVWDCRPSGVSEKITTSSAYNNNINFTSNVDTPAPCPAKWLSKSLTYTENKNGDRHSPCLTPNLHVNVSDVSLSLNTLVRTWLYIKRMMSIIFPRTPKFNSLYHKLPCTK